MSATASPYAAQQKTEAVTAHVLWMTTGLSCEGDSVAMTSATNPSLEGEATALYVQRQLASYPLSITRIARGLPVGGDLEYADGVTIAQALSARRAM